MRLFTAILLSSASIVLAQNANAADKPAPASWPAAASWPALTSSSPTIAHIRKNGAVRCGSAIRPGLAFPDADHVWYGLHVDFCHAIAAVVLGDPSKIEFYGYALRPDFDRIRPGADGLAKDDVSFLTTSELFANELFAAVLPGPTVFQLTSQIMVWESSPVRTIADIGDQTICLEPGTGPERALLLYARQHDWNVAVLGWMELEELMDAFNVGRCPAVAGELTALAALRIGSAHEGHPSRILDEKLSATPVMAATPVSDPAWSVIVTWTINSVLATTPGTAPVTDTLPIAGEWLGLDRGWQLRAAAIGPYSEMVRRALGDQSALRLPPAMTASWRNGGLTLPPTVE